MASTPSSVTTSPVALAVNLPPLASIWRAAKGAEQSTRGGGDDVVDRRGMGLGQRCRIDFVVFGDRAVHAEGDRLRLARQPRDAQRSFDAFEGNSGGVRDVRHNSAHYGF